MTTKSIRRWGLVGLSVAVLVALLSGNFPAALFIGLGTGLLLAVVTNLEVDRTIRN